MNFEKTLLQIKNFRVSEEIEDYDVSEFFDVVIEELPDVNLLTKRQQEQLIKTLFEFLKIQDPEMNENFSFIHFIENIDNPEYEIYYPELLKFNAENGIITSILLLNRYINSLEGSEWKKCLELMKSISENKDYTGYVREFALGFYEYQMGQ
ncbi:MAG: putative RNA methylase [Flammeovirgaceae bacterium]|jgi:predicted RNA methylase